MEVEVKGTRDREREREKREGRKERTKTRRGKRERERQRRNERRRDREICSQSSRSRARTSVVSLPGRSFVTCRAFNASRGKYSRCFESRRFCTESLYRAPRFITRLTRAARQDSNSSPTRRRGPVCILSISLLLLSLSRHASDDASYRHVCVVTRGTTGARERIKYWPTRTSARRGAIFTLPLHLPPPPRAIR